MAHSNECQKDGYKDHTQEIIVTKYSFLSLTLAGFECLSSWGERAASLLH